ncbi:putative claudin-24 [Amia ocellicauda]|uniref:putative claudin-24 n=1 Tax=Amia ocellicauda TaxID=2972642 RepID=UPI003463B324
MDPGMCVAEMLGMFFSIVAWLCSLATTIMPQWLTLSTDLLQTESYQLGLWETCVVQDLGGTECRAYDSMLGLNPNIRLARILMCVTMVVGILGVLLPIPGLYLVNSCNGVEGQRSKRILKVMGGVFSCLAGVTCLVPVSYMAHLAVLKFWDESVPDIVPRWEFGDALFCGWTAGFLHIVAGVLLVCSHLCFRQEAGGAYPRGPPKVTALDASSRKKTEYV